MGSPIGTRERVRAEAGLVLAEVLRNLRLHRWETGECPFGLGVLGINREDIALAVFTAGGNGISSVRLQDGADALNEHAVRVSVFGDDGSDLLRADHPLVADVVDARVAESDAPWFDAFADVLAEDVADRVFGGPTLDWRGASEPRVEAK